eukprot:TRINITY_DN7317_c0_g1_i1.p1 TRINITY_DN7317_c0_g1~~TRINITY_DN7317_c0_g1_i1.p1  ORF type:complete len:116 (-),score=7.87 TRINITY_DN7317_c0_g1_i1:57-404(-)
MIIHNTDTLLLSSGILKLEVGILVGSFNNTTGIGSHYPIGDVYIWTTVPYKDDHGTVIAEPLRVVKKTYLGSRSFEVDTVFLSVVPISFISPSVFSPPHGCTGSQTWTMDDWYSV